MLLEELKWKAIDSNYVMKIAKLLDKKLVIWELNDGEEYLFFYYKNIYGLPTKHWRANDVLTAQAILYHLTENNGAA